MRHLPLYYRFLALALLLFVSSCKAVPFPNSFPPLNGTKANPSIVADMPGCSCQGRWCRDEERTHWSYTDQELDHVAVCPFLKGSAYGFFEDVVGQSELICDELQASYDFRRTNGDLANTGFPMHWNNSYYNVGQQLIRVESGTCDTVYQRQQQCGIDSESYYSTAAWYAPHPTSCDVRDYQLPTTNQTLKIATACLSSFATVDSPRDDRWLLYASWSDHQEEHDIDFCRSRTKDGDTTGSSSDLPSTPSTPEPPEGWAVEDPGPRNEELLQNRSSYPYFPILGREDWIEPIRGRRYVGYDFVDDRANDYCLFVLSLGYEPCHGSPTLRSSASDLGSSSVAPLWVLVVATSLMALG